MIALKTSSPSDVVAHMGSFEQIVVVVVHVLFVDGLVVEIDGAVVEVDVVVEQDGIDVVVDAVVEVEVDLVVGKGKNVGCIVLGEAQTVSHTVDVHDASLDLFPEKIDLELLVNSVPHILLVVLAAFEDFALVVAVHVVGLEAHVEFDAAPVGLGAGLVELGDVG